MDKQDMNELKEVNSAEEAQKLIDEGWQLLETSPDFRILLGREKPISEDTQVEITWSGATKEEIDDWSK